MEILIQSHGPFHGISNTILNAAAVMDSLQRTIAKTTQKRIVARTQKKRVAATATTTMTPAMTMRKAASKRPAIVVGLAVAVTRS